MMRILSLMVRFGDNKYADAPQKLKELFRRQLPNARHELLLIDTSLGRGNSGFTPEGYRIIGADNDFCEFGGWSEGLRHLGSGIKDYDFIHITNSAFLQPPVEYLSRFNESVLRWAKGKRCAVGNIDGYPAEITLYGKKSSMWLRTCFILIQPADLELLENLVFVDSADEIFTSNYRHPFKSECPLSQNYRNYLLGCLTNGEDSEIAKWHSCFDLTEETLPKFVSKTMCILNEHGMSIRLRERGIKLVDVTWLNKRINEGTEPADILSETEQVTERLLSAGNERTNDTTQISQKESMLSKIKQKIKAKLRSVAGINELRQQIDNYSQSLREDLLQRSNALREDLLQRSDALKEDLLQRSDALREDMLQRSDALREDMLQRSDTLRESMLQRSDALREDMLQTSGTLRKEVWQDIENAREKLYLDLGHHLQFSKDNILDSISSQQIPAIGQIIYSLNGELRHDWLLEKLRWLINRQIELNHGDILSLLLEQKHFTQFRVNTDYPVAYESNDHLFPWGAKFTNVRSPGFVFACEKHFPGIVLNHMDLGCGGGGLVLDFLLRGHNSLGIDGSDYSLKTQRALWRLFTDKQLFTADIAKPFSVQDMNGDFKAHVVTAWEFLEHISKPDIVTVFSNVSAHLRDDGIFVGSVTIVRDCVDGVEYHQTVEPKSWWEKRFNENGFYFIGEHEFNQLNFCRGTGNGIMDPDFQKDPGHGFHFVAKKMQ